MKIFKNKFKLVTLATPILLSFMKIRTYAESTIGTQEVEAATNNIKDAVIKLAMPVRKCSYVCKYCNNSY